MRLCSSSYALRLSSIRAASARPDVTTVQASAYSNLICRTRSAGKARPHVGQVNNAPRFIVCVASSYRFRNSASACVNGSHVGSGTSTTESAYCSAVRRSARNDDNFRRNRAVSPSSITPVNVNSLRKRSDVKPDSVKTFTSAQAAANSTSTPSSCITRTNSDCVVTFPSTYNVVPVGMTSRRTRCRRTFICTVPIGTPGTGTHPAGIGSNPVCTFPISAKI